MIQLIVGDLSEHAGRVAGRVTIVTGSGGGMGGAIAMRLAEEGADIVLNDRAAERASRCEEDIRRLGRDVVTVVASVTRREGAQAVVQAALDRWDRVDVLVNVVGGIKGSVRNPVWTMTDDEWDAAVGLNLRGTFLCTQLVAESMMARRSGKIINIASTSWADEEGLHPHYAAAKAGVVAFTRSVAAQLAPYDINVNAVAPGPTATGHAGLDAAAQGNPVDSAAGASTPLGRVNDPVDIANAVLFLASAESRNISGQLVTVAGGHNPSL